MPIYEYQCQKCNHQFEAIQKFSDPALEECPECHLPALKKLISAAAFHLKGSGWYQTDFKNKPSSTNAAGSKAVADECPQAGSCCGGNCAANHSTD